MVAWKRTEGLFVYMNGVKKAESVTATISQPTDSTSNEITIGANSKQEKESFLLMYLAAIDVVKVFPDVQELLEFAPPIIKNSHILTFSSISKESVRNHLKLKIHGPVKENRGTFLFDGIHAFLHDTGEYAGKICCISDTVFDVCTYSMKYVSYSLQPSTEVIETTAKNCVVPVATSNLKLFLKTIW